MMEMETLENIFPKKVVLKRNNKRNIEKLTYSVTEAALAITTNPQNVKDLSEAGYYKHCYVEYRKDDQILTTQDIIFFSLGVSDISQGQADEYVSQLEELIQKYNETFDAFMAEIKVRVDSLNQQITDLTGQAKILQDKLDALKEEISKLGNLHVMYSNSIDFGDYDYSGNPNLMRIVKASDFHLEGDTVVTDVSTNAIYVMSKGAERLNTFTSNNTPSLISGKTYTISAKVKVDEGTTGDIDKIRIAYRKTTNGTILLSTTAYEIEVGKEITVKATGVVNYEITDLSRFYLTIDLEGYSSRINGGVIISDIKIEGSVAKF